MTEPARLATLLGGITIGSLAAGLALFLSIRWSITQILMWLGERPDMLTAIALMMLAGLSVLVAIAGMQIRIRVFPSKGKVKSDVLPSMPASSFGSDRN